MAMPGRRSTSKGDFRFVDVHVGARLRRRREELGLSQMRLAHAMGVIYQLIQKYESGGARVCCSRLSSIATLLDVPVAWFFDGLPRTGAGRVTISVPEHKLYSRETASLAEAYFSLPPVTPPRDPAADPLNDRGSVGLAHL
jgi:transcriptional regulator with XRE-family HTH domain